MPKHSSYDVNAWARTGGPRSLSLFKVVQTAASPFVRGLFNVKATFHAKVPKQGAVILASNHASNIDPVLVLVSVRRPVYHLGKHTLFTSHAKSWFFQHLGGQIPVERGSGGNQAAIDAAVRCVEQGNALGIYPEGHRTPDGRVYRGRTGVARIAVRTGAPVYPVAVRGTFEAWPKGQGFPNLFRPTEVIVGTPRSYPKEPALERDDRLMRTMTDDIMRDLARLLGQTHDPATMPLLQGNRPESP